MDLGLLRTAHRRTSNRRSHCWGVIIMALGQPEKIYYLRTLSIGQWLAYPPRLAVELGSCVGGEAHGWAWKPYGWFDPAPRPRDIIHTYIYGRRPHLAHPVRG